MENNEGRRGRDSLRIRSLREALFHYRQHNMELLKSFSSLHHEQETQVKALEAKQHLMASQLEEKDRLLKEALAAKNQAEKRYSHLKAFTDKMRLDSNKNWECRWDIQERRVAAKEEELRKDHEQQVSQLKSELKTLKEAPAAQKPETKQELMASRMEEKDHLLREALASKAAKEKQYNLFKTLNEKLCADSNRHWEVRWGMREKEMAAKEEALLKRHQQQVAQLTKDNEALRRTLPTEPLAAWEHRKLRAKEPETSSQPEAAEEELKLELLRQTRGAMDWPNLDTKVLVDKLLQLMALSSTSKKTELRGG